MSMRCARRSSMPSSARLPGRSACRTTGRPTASTSRARHRSTRPIPSSMSARDLARFALLYLRKGRWQDRQVVPAQLGRGEHAGLLALRVRARLRLPVVDRPDRQRRCASVELPQGTFFRPGRRRSVRLCHPGLRPGRRSSRDLTRRAAERTGRSAGCCGSCSMPAAFPTSGRMHRSSAAWIPARHGRDAPADPSGQDLGLWRNGKPGPLSDQAQCRRQRSRSPGTRADRARHRLLECPRGPALPCLEEARVPVLGRRQ